MINFRQTVTLADGYAAAYLEARPERYDTTLLMVHGIRGSADGLADLLGPLGKKYRVIVPDLPAHAGLDSLPESTPEAYARWLVEFTEAIEAKGRVVLLGHSFGVLIVWEALPDRRFHSLILLNPVCPQGFWDRLVEFYYFIADILPAAWQRGWLKLKPVESLTQYLLIHNRTKANVAKVAALHRQESEVLQPLPVIRLMRSLWPWLKQVDLSEAKKPVAVIAGENDRLSSLSQVKAFYSAAAGIDPQVIPEAGHISHIDRLDEVVAAIERAIEMPSKN